MNKIYTSEVYTVDPSSVRFDQHMVEFNRVHTIAEYERTKESIAEVGQLTPIDINDKTGLSENGRHRVKACMELGIQVACIQINGDLPESTRLQIYNQEQISGKDFTTAQKAIQAHKYAKIANISLEKAAKKFNTNQRAVNAVNTIAGLGRQDILHSMEYKGYWMDSAGKKIKDLRSIASQLKAESEQVLENKLEVTVNYEDLITTEIGKAEFWRKRTLANMSQHELSMMIVENMNYKYKLVTDEVTGEIIGE